MAEAFGNIWPQYRAGYRQRYQGGGVVTDTPPDQVYVPQQTDTPPDQVYVPPSGFVTVRGGPPAAFDTGPELGRASGESRGAGADWGAPSLTNADVRGGPPASFNTPTYNPAPIRQAIAAQPGTMVPDTTGGSTGVGMSWDTPAAVQGGPPASFETASPVVRRAQPVALPGSIPGPDTPPAQVYAPRPQPQVRRAQLVAPQPAWQPQQSQQSGLGHNFLQALAHTIAHLYMGTLGQHRAQPVQHFQQGGYVQQNPNQSPYEPLQPEQLPSDISAQDLSGLAASGEGEPQSRYNMGGFNPGLSNIGGFTGAGGNAGSGFMDVVGGVLGGLEKQKGGGGGGLSGGTPGTASAGGGYVDPNTGYYIGASPGAGESGYAYPDASAASAAGDTGSGMGGGGMGGGGISGGQAGSLAASAILGFGQAAQQANKPVTVNPSEWANPPPQPVTFTFPTLTRNTGGTAPWA